MNSIEDIVKKLEDEKTQLGKALSTREEFVELIHSYMETAFNTRDLIEEDAAYQEVVSKLRVKDDVVSVIKLNPPYNLLVDLGEISSGREEQFLLELLDYVVGVIK